MTRFRNNFDYLVIAVLLAILLLGCGNNGANELREFAQVEAAIGLVAGASSFERLERLEQLDHIHVNSKRVTDLQKMCGDAYRAFNKSASLLETARQKTESVEKEVTRLKGQKASGATISTEEELRILEMSKNAALTLKSVTAELDSAEEKVAACQAKRQELRHLMADR